MKIDITISALLRYSKGPDGDFTWKGLAELLAPIYSYNMMLPDVFRVVCKAYLTAIKEPRFQFPWDNDSNIINLILSPVLGHRAIFNNYGLSSNLSVEEFYNSLLNEMMTRFMLTRIDWLNSDYTEEKQVAKVRIGDGLNITSASNIVADTFMFGSKNGIPVIKIHNTGVIVWNGKEVEGDDEFKASMLELRKLLGELR